jgi:hypothetical protein
MIERRYFISSPKANDLASPAKKLANKLRSRVPNQRNIVVYKFEPSAKKRGWGKKYIGYLDVHRSLDKTSPHILSFTSHDPSKSIHDPDVVNHASSMYAVIKIQSFVRKLALLNAELKEKLPAEKRESYLSNRVSPMQIIMFAILSDIAAELMHFNAHSWRDGVGAKDVAKRLNTLNELSIFPFDSVTVHKGWTERLSSVAGDVLLELVVHIEMLADSFVSIWDRILPRRRATTVAGAAKKFAWEIILSLLDGPKKEVDREARLRAQAKARTWHTLCAREASYGHILKNVDRKKNQQEYHFPTGLASGPCDTHSALPPVLSFQEFAARYVPIRSDNVVEGKYMVHTDADRVRIIENTQREFQCPKGTESKSRTIVTPNVYPF